MTPEAHDRHVAVTSHVPHAAAVALVRAATHFASLDTASTGFADTTRLASSNPPMRADIMCSNRVALAAALDAYLDEVRALKDVVLHGDRATLVAMLEVAHAQRDAWLHARTDFA